ncbi:MAG: hypothetical protein JNL62_08920 [Bryobacterales bacterium]|nr:hypothetical protein [Bryobacterales bacterium]
MTLLLVPLLLIAVADIMVSQTRLNVSDFRCPEDDKAVTNQHRPLVKGKISQAVFRGVFKMDAVEINNGYTLTYPKQPLIHIAGYVNDALRVTASFYGVDEWAFAEGYLILPAREFERIAERVCRSRVIVRSLNQHEADIDHGSPPYIYISFRTKLGTALGVAKALASIVE